MGQASAPSGTGGGLLQGTTVEACSGREGLRGGGGGSPSLEIQLVSEMWWGSNSGLNAISPGRVCSNFQVACKAKRP